MTSFLSFPELGKTFLETTNLRNTPRPGSLSFHGPQDVEAAALEALGKSMAKSMGNHGFPRVFHGFLSVVYLFYPFFTTNLEGFPADLGSNPSHFALQSGWPKVWIWAHPVQSYSNSTTVVQKTLGAHSTL